MIFDNVLINRYIEIELYWRLSKNIISSFREVIKGNNLEIRTTKIDGRVVSPTPPLKLLN